MNVESNIQSAEKKFIPVLEEFFKSVYNESSLPSHGIDHHRRVWNYAKELLQYLHQKEEKTDRNFVEKLLIACYLHDIGMAIDPGERHGLHSRRLCEQFLSANNLDLSDFQDVLEAIDNHDNKEYTDSPVINRLLFLLSAADDLDSFGYIGIYRYLEIYLARGILPEKIGPMARDNAEKRFKNFRLHFSSSPELVKKHWARYQVLDKFFEGFCKETDSK